MKPLTKRHGAAVVLGTLLTLAACGHDPQQSPMNVLAPRALGDTPQLDATSKLVTIGFDPANFANGVANPYFPLDAGRVWIYATQSDAGLEVDTVEVTQDTKSILGVTAHVIHDRVYLDGSLTENTFDWYAEDDDGNVWYLGEDTKTYDHGTFVSDEGSWTAGEDGAGAGIIMLAHPEKGDVYQQENSPGVVEDRGKVVALDETAVVPAGTFEHCLKTSETTPIEPGVREFKYYAAGVGNVLEVSHSGRGERVELMSYSPRL